MVDRVGVPDVVVEAHAAVAAPVGAVGRVVRVQVRAEPHDDLALVLPRGHRGGGGRSPARGGAGWGLRVEEGEVQVVEEGLLPEEVVALGLQALARGGVRGHEADVVDGADVEHGGGQAEAVPVLAEGFEEGVGGVVVALARLVDDCDRGAGHEEEIERLVREGVVEVPGAVYFGQACCHPFFVAHVDDRFVLGLG